MARGMPFYGVKRRRRLSEERPPDPGGYRAQGGSGCKTWSREMLSRIACAMGGVAHLAPGGGGSGGGRGGGGDAVLDGGEAVEEADQVPLPQRGRRRRVLEVVQPCIACVCARARTCGP